MYRCTCIGQEDDEVGWEQRKLVVVAEAVEVSDVPRILALSLSPSFFCLFLPHFGVLEIQMCTPVGAPHRGVNHLSLFQMCTPVGVLEHNTLHATG